MSKSGKPVEANASPRTKPRDVPTPPVPRDIVGIDAHDSTYPAIDQARVGQAIQTSRFGRRCLGFVPTTWPQTHRHASLPLRGRMVL